MSNNHSATHPAHLHHHFADSEQQRESAKLGMWFFLLTEVLTFGGLFCAYAIYRSWYPEMFSIAHRELNVTLGTINTVVLITSSLTMALAIRSMQLNNKSMTITMLLCTFLLAGTFMVIKYFEYTHKIHVGQLPGKYYFFQGIDANNPHIFFSIYFAMTGLHGLHVMIGMGVIAWLMYRTSKNEFSSEYYTPIDMTVLFWHLVDLIWIFLFPLFYLIS